jgi:broad specificity phosphatase PhoE
MPVVYLIRHGQASFGAADYDVLSAVGHKQAELVAAALVRRGVQPKRIASGSLRRQLDTATVCAAVAPFDVPIDTDPRWDEFNQLDLIASDWPASGEEVEPDAARSTQLKLDAALLNWIGPGARVSAGQSWPQFQAKALGAHRDLMASLPSGGAALAFTSAGVIGAICADLLGLGAAGVVALNRVAVNTGITKIVSGRSGASLLSFNDHGHLEGAADLLTYR